MPNADSSGHTKELTAAGAFASKTAPASLIGQQIGMAFAMLQGAVKDAAERQNVQITAELERLRARALSSIEDSALATIALFEALGAARSPVELANDLASRQLEIARRRQVEFVETAQDVVAALTDPLTRMLGANADRGGAEDGDSVSARINSLTCRQKKVLALLATGLPNKVIAHELGISETTVKAHVGEILRKLKVYNRARAIVMLSQHEFSAAS